MTPLKSFRSKIIDSFTAFFFLCVVILGVHSFPAYTAAQTTAEDLFGAAAADESGEEDQTEDVETGYENIEAETSLLAEAVLKENPNIERAHGIWKLRIGEANSKYLRKLETFWERERTKGGLDFIKGMEKTMESARKHHQSPCILIDRVPPKIGEWQVEMNKAKSAANRAFIAVLDKEIATAIKQDDIEKAKTLEQLPFIFFLPAKLSFRFAVAVRHGNKIYLYNEMKKTWTNAYAWSRERHGDLASIGNKETNDLLLKIMRKQTDGVVRQSWSGGIRVDDKFQWTDGTPFRYTNWVKGQPSGVSHKAVRQDYISFAVHKAAGWDDNSNFPLPFMVQWTLY